MRWPVVRWPVVRWPVVRWPVTAQVSSVAIVSWDGDPFAARRVRATRRVSAPDGLTGSPNGG
jgi:hypothetical protein